MPFSVIFAQPPDSDCTDTLEPADNFPIILPLVDDLLRTFKDELDCTFTYFVTALFVDGAATFVETATVDGTAALNGVAVVGAAACLVLDFG